MQQPLSGRAMRLVAAHRRKRLLEHPLQVRKPDDLAGLVVRGRHVANLGEGKEPFVTGVGTRDPAEEVDVLDRIEPLDVELGEPAEIEPFGEHRMHVAVPAILLERSIVGARVAHVVGLRSALCRRRAR